MIQRNEACRCGFSVDRKCDFCGNEDLTFASKYGWGGRQGQSRVIAQYGDHREVRQTQKKIYLFLKVSSPKQNTVIMMKHPSKSIL